MISKIRSWIFEWLGLTWRLNQIRADVDSIRSSNMSIIRSQTDAIVNLEVRLKAIQAEVARLSVAQYVPPQPEEPKPKVIQTRTMREYNAILEREFEHEEA